MSNNLALGTLPEGVESPEVLINGAFGAIDSLLTESFDIDLSAANAAPTAIDLRRSSFISLLGAAQARDVVLPVAKRTLFLKNYGTAEVTLKCGTKSIAVPAGQARTVRLTGATDGLEDIGGGGSGGGSGGVPEAPTDGKQYGRQNGAWTEVVAGEGGGGDPGGGDPFAEYVPYYKIWRFYCTETRNEGQPLAISQLKVFDVAGTDITSQIVSITAKSTNSASEPIQNVLDEDTATYWRSAGQVNSQFNIEWIQIEFGGIVDLAEFRMRIQTGWYERFPTAGYITGRNASTDPEKVTVSFNNGRAGPIVDTTMVPFQTVKRIIYGAGAFPVNPPKPAEYNLSFTNASSAGSMIANDRVATLLRSEKGVSSVDVNYIRLRPGLPAIFTYDALFLAQNVNRYGYQRMGIALRESATDKYLTLIHASEANNPVIARLSFTGANAANGGFTSFVTLDGGVFFDIWLRIKGTATDYEFYISYDYGLTFELLTTYPKTTYFTTAADQIGIYINTYGTVGKNPRLVCPYANLS